MVNNLCPNKSTCYDYCNSGRGCDGCNLAYNTINRTSIDMSDALDNVSSYVADRYKELLNRYPSINSTPRYAVSSDPLADYYHQPTQDIYSFRLPRVFFRDGHHEDMIMFKPKSGRDFEFYIPSGYYACKGEIYKYHQEHIKMSISASEDPGYDISDCWFPDTEIAGIEGLNINCFAVIDWDTEDYTD